MPATAWERIKTGGKAGFDKTWQALDKLGAPVNRLSNKLGSEAFWPTTLDKESDKAARILKSFCKDGFYKEEEFQPQDGPKQKQKVLQKIPESVMKGAKGLAIFTGMRTGLWISGAGGSGVLVARKADGTWSPPSGILLHTAGVGFLIGADIYDCVIVINTEEAMKAFTKVRCTLGSEISIAAGPVGAGGVLDTEVHKRQAPIYTYLKSRGFYAGVAIDGSIIIERFDENERFYGQRLAVQEILEGKVRHAPYEVRRLMETIKAAQGDRDVDESMIPTEAAPGDFEIQDGHLFGVPDNDDPDPYGVLALEKEGMSLKEAGTKKRASWEEFSFNPSPTSPVHDIVARKSGERARSVSQRSSWRTSAFGNHDPKTPSSLRNSMDQSHATLTSDTATLDDEKSPSPSRDIPPNGHHVHMQDLPENEVLDTSPERKEAANVDANGHTTTPHTPPTANEEHDDDLDEDAAIIEEPVVHSVQTMHPTSPSVISKARLVTVPKRIPPKLPPRNPSRNGPVLIDASPKHSTEFEKPSVIPNESESEHNVPSEPESEPKNDGFEPAPAETHGGLEALKEQMYDVKLDEPEPDVAQPRSPIQLIDQQEVEKQEKMPGGFD